MAIIRVNPGSLIQKAGEITSVATNIQNIGTRVFHIANSAPSYDGQFNPKVRSIAQAALARAQKHDARMNTLSGSLAGRATAFQSADQVSVSGLLVKTLTPTSLQTIYLQLLASIIGVSIKQVMRLLLLGSLWFPALSVRWAINLLPVGFIFSKRTGRNSTATLQTPTTSVKPPIPISLTFPILPYSGIKDCYAFVKFQRENNSKTMPTGMCGKPGQGLYDGSRHGQSGSFTSGGQTYKFGQEPRLGAIMVESPSYSSHKKVTHGHVSIVSEMVQDETGKVTSFSISESNWDEPEKTFTWNAENQRFENPTGRVYDCFVY